jgi:uncharacterized protein
MRIDVRDILIEDIGFSRSFAFAGETPELDNVTLTSPIDGEVTVTKLEEILQAEGEFETTIELECHRCLNTFEQPVHHRFSRSYAETPNDDDLPIEERQIDIAEAIRDEIIVRLPIKLLCKEDCDGIKVDR